MKKFTNIIALLLIISTYSEWIEVIKEHEGFRKEVYEDIFGNKTQFYGHLIKEGEYFVEKTRKKGEQVLDDDFNGSIRLITNLYPEMSEQQILPLAHFVFAKGIGSYTKSKLKIAIDNKESDKKIFKEWIEWGVVGGKISHKSMYNRVLEYTTFINARANQIQNLNGGNKDK